MQIKISICPVQRADIAPVSGGMHCNVMVIFVGIDRFLRHGELNLCRYLIGFIF